MNLKRFFLGGLLGLSFWMGAGDARAVSSLGDKERGLSFRVVSLDPQTIVRKRNQVYKRRVRRCLRDGWSLGAFDLEGTGRLYAVKKPLAPIKAVVINFHGALGDITTSCSAGLLGRAGLNLSNAFLKHGYAVILAESRTDFKDENGRSCGKRFDATRPYHDNADLKYAEYLIKKVAPEIAPGAPVFLLGVSRGGMMALRAGTYFSQDVAAVAVAATAFPFSKKVPDCKAAPMIGADIDRRDPDSGLSMNVEGACDTEGKEDFSWWDIPRDHVALPIKQFHHEGDAVFDVSCVAKAARGLRYHGFKVEEPYIIPNYSRRDRLSFHAWFSTYEPVLFEFFERYLNK